MNAKKKEELLNENINPQIDDLPVTDEQAELAKGGQRSMVTSIQVSFSTMAS